MATIGWGDLLDVTKGSVVGGDVDCDSAVAVEDGLCGLAREQFLDGVLAVGHLSTIEGVLGNADGGFHLGIAKVGNHQRHLAVTVAQEGVLLLRV